MSKTPSKWSRPPQSAAKRPDTHHHAHMRRAAVTRPAAADENPYVVVRVSKIHGRGVYAPPRHPQGTRNIEDLGDRI
jgi:hypothetical protein